MVCGIKAGVRVTGVLCHIRKSQTNIEKVVLIFVALSDCSVSVHVFFNDGKPELIKQ